MRNPLNFLVIFVTDTLTPFDKYGFAISELNQIQLSMSCKATDISSSGKYGFKPCIEMTDTSFGLVCTALIATPGRLYLHLRLLQFSQLEDSFQVWSLTESPTLMDGEKQYT